MSRLFLLLGAANGFLAVAFGAFGAHGLEDRLSPEQLAVYGTGVEYHTTHALGLLAVGIIAHWLPNAATLRWAGWLFLLGIVLFSGSLYLLSVTGLSWLGMVTPFGGTAFLAGWIFLAAAALKV